MTRMATIVAAALALAACGSDTTAADPPSREYSQSADAPNADAPSADAASPDAPRADASARGTAITVRNSEFGRMLFNTKRQAIYIFQLDRRNRTNCYGECARLWPPVYTKGKPRALNGVKASLLGTIKRRGGRLQVTYAGKPLYYYDHEGPGEVRCHNVFLNGGLWWVIGPNGKRRP